MPVYLLASSMRQPKQKRCSSRCRCHGSDLELAGAPNALRLTAATMPGVSASGCANAASSRLSRHASALESANQAGLVATTNSTTVVAQPPSSVLVGSKSAVRSPPATRSLPATTSAWSSSPFLNGTFACSPSPPAQAYRKPDWQKEPTQGET